MSAGNATAAVVEAIDQVKAALLSNELPVKADSFLDTIDQFEDGFRAAAGMKPSWWDTERCPNCKDTNVNDCGCWDTLQEGRS